MSLNHIFTESNVPDRINATFKNVTSGTVTTTSTTTSSTFQLIDVKQQASIGMNALTERKHDLTVSNGFMGLGFPYLNTAIMSNQYFEGGDYKNVALGFSSKILFDPQSQIHFTIAGAQKAAGTTSDNMTRFLLDNNGDTHLAGTIFGAPLPQNSQGGFPRLPILTGMGPTGVPFSPAVYNAPIVIGDTFNKPWIYNGGWFDLPAPGGIYGYLVIDDAKGTSYASPVISSVGYTTVSQNGILSKARGMVIDSNSSIANSDGIQIQYTGTYDIQVDISFSTAVVGLNIQTAINRYDRKAMTSNILPGNKPEVNTAVMNYRNAVSFRVVADLTSDDSIFIAMTASLPGNSAQIESWAINIREISLAP